jgi:hypothetical protein
MSGRGARGESERLSEPRTPRTTCGPSTASRDPMLSERLALAPRVQVHKKVLAAAFRARGQIGEETEGSVRHQYGSSARVPVSSSSRLSGSSPIRSPLRSSGWLPPMYTRTRPGKNTRLPLMSISDRSRAVRVNEIR